MELEGLRDEKNSPSPAPLRGDLKRWLAAEDATFLD